MFFVKILWKADINRCACEGKFGGCLELRMMKFGWKLSFFFFFEEMMYENVGNTREFVEGIEGNRKITKLELEGS